MYYLIYIYDIRYIKYVEYTCICICKYMYMYMYVDIYIYIYTYIVTVLWLHNFRLVADCDDPCLGIALS